MPFAFMPHLDFQPEPGLYDTLHAEVAFDVARARHQQNRLKALSHVRVLRLEQEGLRPRLEVAAYWGVEVCGDCFTTNEQPSLYVLMACPRGGVEPPAHLTIQVGVSLKTTQGPPAMRWESYLGGTETEDPAAPLPGIDVRYPYLQHRNRPEILVRRWRIVPNVPQAATLSARVTVRPHEWRGWGAASIAPIEVSCEYDPLAAASWGTHASSLLRRLFAGREPIARAVSDKNLPICRITGPSTETQTSEPFGTEALTDQFTNLEDVASAFVPELDLNLALLLLAKQLVEAQNLVRGGTCPHRVNAFVNVGSPVLSAAPWLHMLPRLLRSHGELRVVVEIDSSASGPDHLGGAAWLRDNLDGTAFACDLAMNLLSLQRVGLSPAFVKVEYPYFRSFVEGRSPDDPLERGWAPTDVLIDVFEQCARNGWQVVVEGVMHTSERDQLWKLAQRGGCSGFFVEGSFLEAGGSCQHGLFHIRCLVPHM